MNYQNELPDAVLLRKTETRRGTTFVYQHITKGWLVDNDREIVKITKGSPQTTEVVERTWTNVDVPFPVPPKLDKKAIPILINPLDPIYQWAEAPPPKYHPCFLVPDKKRPANFVIIDARTGKTIGKGVEVP